MKQPTLKGEQLKKAVLASVNKMFEGDSKHFMDGPAKRNESKGKAAA